MTTEIVTKIHQIEKVNGLTPPLKTLLGSRDLAEHRALLAFELEVLAKKYDRFGWERDRGTPAQDRLITDWMAALDNYPLDEVQAACRIAVKNDPRNMPNEGHIGKIILDGRARAVAMHKYRNPQPIDNARTVSPDMADRAQQILSDVFGEK